MNVHVVSARSTMGKMNTRRLMSMVCGVCLIWGCSSEDMKTQPFFSYQEAPRRHSPPDSVPYSHSSSMPRNGETDAYAPQVPPAQGEAIYVVNCSHCHGPEGNGDGAMAGYLKEVPANLHSPEVQNKPSSVLLQSVTDGINVMPAFKPYLTTEEREAVVDFIRSFSPTKTEGNTP